MLTCLWMYRCQNKRKIPFCKSLFEQSSTFFPSDLNSLQCRVKRIGYSEGSGVWSMECQLWVGSVECVQRKMRSVESRVWSVECKVQSSEGKVWSAKSGMMGVKCEVWGEKCGVWSVVCTVWSEGSGVQGVKCWMRSLQSGNGECGAHCLERKL